MFLSHISYVCFITHEAYNGAYAQNMTADHQENKLNRYEHNPLRKNFS